MVDRIDLNINSLEELKDDMKSYMKLNHEPVDSIIDKLKSYKESINSEVEKIKGV